MVRVVESKPTTAVMTSCFSLAFFSVRPTCAYSGSVKLPIGFTGLPADFSTNPLQNNILGINQDNDHDKDLNDHRGHVLHPLNGRVMSIDITLYECVRYDGLCATDMDPAPAKRISGDLGHRE